jgi:hypothetical protein
MNTHEFYTSTSLHGAKPVVLVDYTILHGIIGAAAVSDEAKSIIENSINDLTQ